MQSETVPRRRTGLQRGKLVDVTAELKTGNRPLNEMFDHKNIEEARENEGELKRG